TGEASSSHCGSRSSAPRYSEVTTNVTASQPIQGCLSATARAATPAIAAIAGTKASAASVSRQMVCGSPIVRPAPRPMPRPAKNISTVDPTTKAATAGTPLRPNDNGRDGGDHPAPPRHRPGKHRFAQPGLLVAPDPQHTRDDIGGGRGGKKLRQRGVHAVRTLLSQHPLQEFVGLGRIEKRLRHRPECQAGQKQSNAPADCLT